MHILYGIYIWGSSFNRLITIPSYKKKKKEGFCDMVGWWVTCDDRVSAKGGQARTWRADSGPTFGPVERDMCTWHGIINLPSLSRGVVLPTSHCTVVVPSRYWRQDEQAWRHRDSFVLLPWRLSSRKKTNYFPSPLSTDNAKIIIWTNWYK